MVFFVYVVIYTSVNSGELFKKVLMYLMSSIPDAMISQLTLQLFDLGLPNTVIKCEIQ